MSNATPRTDAAIKRAEECAANVVVRMSAAEKLAGQQMVQTIIEEARTLERDRAELIEIVWAYLQTAANPKALGKLPDVDARARSLLTKLKDNS